MVILSSKGVNLIIFALFGSFYASAISGLLVLVAERPVINLGHNRLLHLEGL